MTVLLDAGDYPLGQHAIGGIGLRIAELATALAQHFPVHIYSPATTEDESIDVGPAILFTSADDWAEVMADAQAILLFDMPDFDRITQAVAAGKLIISENAPPIEQLEYPRYRDQSPEIYQGLLEAYRYQIAHSDHFIARAPVERVSMIANLCHAGRITADDICRSRTLEHLITMVPIGYSTAALAAAQTVASAPGERTELLWTGGLWSFLDPIAAVRAVAYLRHQRGTEATLRFLHAAPHPDTADTVADIRETAARLDISDLVVLHTDPISHAERDGFLRSAAGLVCLAHPGIENDLCVRLRVRDSRLYGLPLVVNLHSPTATDLGAEGLAHPVNPDNVGDVSDRMLSLLDTNDGVAPGDHRWTYENTTGPLVEYLTRYLS